MPSARTAAFVCGISMASAAAGADTGQESQPARPFRHLFGTVRTAERQPGSRQQTLDLTATLAGAYDDQLEPQQASVADIARMRGPYANADLTAKYLRAGRTFSVAMDSETAIRYYPDLHGTSSTNQRVSSEQRVRLGRRAELQFSQRASYQPLSLLTVGGPSDAETVEASASSMLAGDYSMTTQRTYAYNGDVGITAGIGRATMALGYEFRRVDGDAAFDLSVHRGFVRFTQPVTRYASLRLGYGRREARFGGADGGRPAGDHDIDAGVDFDRPISASRKTTITFGSGSSLVGVEGTTRFHLSGSAALKQEIGRTWTARLDYGRRVQMLEGFTSPALTNTVNLSTSGMVGPRVRLSASATGDAATGSAKALETYTRYRGTSELTFDMSRHTQLLVRYVYQLNDLGDALAPNVELLRRLNGHTVRVGLTLWAEPLR